MYGFVWKLYMIGNLPNKFSSEQDNLICHDRFFFFSETSFGYQWGNQVYIYTYDYI